MASPDVALQAIAAVIGAATGLGALIVKFLKHPEGKYGEKVKKLQKDRWSEVSTELGVLLDEVEEAVDLSADGGSDENPPRHAKYSMHIQKEYNRGDLDGIVDLLEAVDEPRTLFETCREARDAVIDRLALAFVGIMIIVVVMFTGDSELTLSVGSLVAGGSLALVGSAIKNAVAWRKARQKLDELWEDYEYM